MIKGPRKPVVGICRLCGQERELVEGHFIPGFVYRWLKETSVGAIRSTEAPDRRVQDGPKRFFTCAECDGGVLSALEKHFKDLVFAPLHDRDYSDGIIQLDERVHRF